MLNLMPFERKNSSPSNYFDDLEKSFFNDFEPMMRLPEFRTDIADNGDSFTLEAELPGFDRGDIKIDLDGEMLTISAEHSEDSKKKEKNYLRRERRYGSFSRRFDVSGINTDGITAGYNNGVLELVLPKKEPSKPAVKQIEIK